MNKHYHPVKKLLLLFCFLIFAVQHTVLAQADFQGWINAVVGYNALNQLYLEGNFEYKQLLSESEDPWRSLSFTLTGEYYPTRLLDLTVDITSGKTHQTGELVSDEASQILGAKWYILQLGHNLFRLSKGTDGAPERIEFSNHIRFEHRNFDYYNDLPPENDWRFRDRTQFVISLNKKTFFENRTIRLLADAEFFIPFGKEATERYVTKYRIRIGPGYRHNVHWRFNLYYMYDKSSDTIGDPYETSSHMVNLQMFYII
jgi:hypothetical protein